MVLALCARVVCSASAAYNEDSSEHLLLRIVEPSPNENRYVNVVAVSVNTVSGIITLLTKFFLASRR